MAHSRGYISHNISAVPKFVGLGRHFSQSTKPIMISGSLYTFPDSDDGCHEFFPGRPIHLVHKGKYLYILLADEKNLPSPSPQIDSAHRIDSLLPAKILPKDISNHENDGLYSEALGGEPAFAIIYGQLYHVRAFPFYPEVPQLVIDV